MTGGRSGKERKKPIPFPIRQAGEQLPKFARGDFKSSSNAASPESGGSSSSMINDGASISDLKAVVDIDGGLFDQHDGATNVFQPIIQASPEYLASEALSSLRNTEAVNIASALKDVSPRDKDRLIAHLATVFSTNLGVAQPQPIEIFARFCFRKGSAPNFTKNSVYLKNSKNIPTTPVTKTDSLSRTKQVAGYTAESAAQMVVEYLALKNYPHLTQRFRQILANSDIPAIENCLNHNLD